MGVEGPAGGSNISTNHRALVREAVCFASKSSWCDRAASSDSFEANQGILILSAGGGVSSESFSKLIWFVATRACGTEDWRKG